MKIVDRIMYEGDNTTFIWKHPAEDFNTMSQLIVSESQEALLFVNGQALDLYGPGRYTLNTQNIPLLRRIINIPTGGESPFHCEVYFINKTEQMAINWGMGNVNFMDPVHNDIPFEIGASGTMSLRISDSRKIILKLVGTENMLTQETIKRYFKDLITMHIKTMLPNILREKGISIFDVENDLSGLSTTLKKRISDVMAEYGISLEKFWIATIVKPESDPTYKELIKLRARGATIDTQGALDKKQANIDAEVQVIRYGGEVAKKKMDADAEAYAQEKMGYTFQQKEGFKVLNTAAGNEGSGSAIPGAMIGMGVGAGIGGVIGQGVASIANAADFSSLSTPPAPTAPSSTGVSGTQSDVPGMISLKDETEEKPEVDDDMAEFQKKLQKIQMMKEANLLSDEDFINLKKKLLSELGIE